MLLDDDDLHEELNEEHDLIGQAQGDFKDIQVDNLNERDMAFEEEQPQEEEFDDQVDDHLASTPSSSTKESNMSKARSIQLQAKNESYGMQNINKKAVSSGIGGGSFQSRLKKPTGPEGNQGGNIVK